MFTKFPMQLLLAATAMLFTLASCNKDDDHDHDALTPGNIEIELDHRWGSEPFSFGKYYVTPNGDSVNFKTFNYYLSNFILTDEDGKDYVVPKDDCYFLVKHDVAASRVLVLKNIPGGHYTNVSFTIGVDSLKSVSAIEQRTGVLDPATGGAGMYWAWNSGYIFCKLEGTSPSGFLNTTTGEKVFQYHIGGFGGFTTKTFNNIKKVKLTPPAGNMAHLENGTSKTPTYHLYVNVKDFFESPTKLDVKQYPIVMVNPYSTTIAENYKDMFSIDHIHN
jgi:hypothetical protein